VIMKAADDVRHRGEQRDRAKNADREGMIAPSPRWIRRPRIADMALVSDMSGVYSSRETRRMTPSPMNVASTKHEQHRSEVGS